MYKFTTAAALAASVVSTALFASIGPSFALDPGNYSFQGDLGKCKVRIRNHGNNGSADVVLQVGGDPTAGGAIFLQGNPVKFTALTSAHVASCGIKNIAKWKVDGPSGNFAQDNYIGFSFEGWYKGTRAQYEFALTKAPGETRTHAVFSYYFYSTPTISFNK